MADIEPIGQQPISDDQELAKVLAGIDQQVDTPATDSSTTTSGTDDMVLPEPAADAAATDAALEQITMPDPIATPVADAVVSPTTMTSGTSDDLSSVKQEALSELRPLVDKLDVSPEEKFDTYLLLLRSTDDKDLIAPAHEAAKNISDEARRAQALLDIIKEIDFLTQNAAK